MYNSVNIDDIFHKLQDQFVSDYTSVFHDDLLPRTVVVIPSLTLDHHLLSKIKGHFYYEERMLCMLMLLRMPETKLTFVTSIPISPLIIDYYLHMLPGITSHHARTRLTLLSCYDAGNVPLTEKILSRPKLITRIKNSCHSDKPAHIIFFNVTEAEKTLAVKLNLPMYGCDPALNYLGTKSGSRTIFKECKILTPDGFENITSKEEIIEAIYHLKVAKPHLEKVVIKLNDGFSGDGNAIFHFTNAPDGSEALRDWIKTHLKKNTKIIAKKLKFDSYIQKMEVMGGIVEEFLAADIITSPSVQVRINPVGEICIISTHDQVLGGESGQVFIGATFPADASYAVELKNISMILAEKMRMKGVLGRFGIDFMSVMHKGKWQHYAIEINLRKGGTTHPFLMLQFLTNGTYHQDTGEYILADGTQRYYFATDNLQKDKYKGLTPPDLFDIVMYYGLHFEHNKEEGVMFHLISALSQFGKLGLVSIGKTPERAMAYYNKVIEILDKEIEIKPD